MSLETGVTVVVHGLGLYFTVGLLYGLYFVTTVVGRLDSVAREGSKGFRLLILPGVAALWPFLLLRQWQRRAEPLPERNPHRDAALNGAGDPP